MSLAIAKIILKKTRDQYPLGSSNINTVYSSPLNGKIYRNRNINPQLFSRTFDSLVDNHRQQLADQRIHENRGICTKFLEILSASALPTAIVRNKLRRFIAERTSFTGAGNCEELTTYAFLLIADRYPYIKTEFVYLDRENIISQMHQRVTENLKPDHVFIVINRKSNKRSIKLHECNRDMIILDPWLNESEYLYNFLPKLQYNIWGIPLRDLVIVKKFSTDDFHDRHTNTSVSVSQQHYTGIT